MKTKLSLCSLLYFSLALPSPAAEQDAGLRFAKIFGDGMVLQRDKPIQIWGWAKPGSKVDVTLSQDPELGAKAIEDSVAAGTRKAIGQSDPEEYSVRVEYVESNPPKVERRSIATTANGEGRWKVSFPAAPASFQPTWIAARSGEATIAVENVLIGEIWVCAGQSNMGWSNFNRKGREAASADFPGLRYIAWHDSWYKPLDDVRSNIRWQECSPENATKFAAVPYLYGMFLHRYLKVPVGVINVARGGTLGQTWCTREQLEGVDHKIMETVLADYDAETAIWDDPKKVEAIIAEWEIACEAAKEAHATKLAEAKAAGKKEPRLRLPKQPGDPRSGWSPPAGLFNATVMPIRHLGIRGVLYYQGENNNFMKWTRYEHTFPRIPASFRSAFGDESLPFGCISQPGWGTFGIDPEVATVAEGYAIVRDVQRRALKGDANAGMIATYPTGNSYIHPAEKLPVAEYASLWALANVYDAPVVHRAGEYQKMEKKDGKIYVFFDSDPVVFDRWKHIENNASWQVLPQPREGNAERQGFIIAGEDRRWYPGKAREVKLDGKWCIEVSSDLVGEPVAVRYGWANWPTGNMVGRERLPLATFRTDDWPIPEGLSYSPEAQKASGEKIKALKDAGAKQALDRKIRQAQIDLRALEGELYKGDAAGQLASKLQRMRGVVGELREKGWLADQLAREDPEMAAKLEKLEAMIDEIAGAPAAGGEE